MNTTPGQSSGTCRSVATYNPWPRTNLLRCAPTSERPRRQRAHLVTRAITSNKTYWKAAEYVVEHFIRDRNIIALGSGPLAAAVTESLADALSLRQRQGIQIIAASDAAAAEAAIRGLTQTDLQTHPKVDVMCCDVDSLDRATLAFVVGCQQPGNMQQQPQLVRFNRLAAASQQIIALVSDRSKVMSRLAGSMPITIKANNWEETSEQIDDIFLGDAEIWRRPSHGPADPRGGLHPYTSPEGHQLLDVNFDGTMKLYGKEVAYEELAREIEAVDGVVAHGLMIQTANLAVVAGEEGPQVLLPSDLQ